MISAPSLTGAALLLGLSLFLGLAFEDFFANSKIRRPGGIRTFPLLAAAGGVLYLFDPTHFLPFTAGPRRARDLARDLLSPAYRRT